MGVWDVVGELGVRGALSSYMKTGRADPPMARARPGRLHTAAVSALANKLFQSWSHQGWPASSWRLPSRGERQGGHVVEMSPPATHRRRRVQDIGRSPPKGRLMLVADRRDKSLTCSAGPRWRNLIRRRRAPPFQPFRNPHTRQEQPPGDEAKSKQRHAFAHPPD